MSDDNVITDENISKMTTAVMGRPVCEPIALYIHDDAAAPGETTLKKLPYFPDRFFQGGMDVFMPAADAADGTITVTNLPRGDAQKPQTLMVVFSDFPQG